MPPHSTLDSRTAVGLIIAIVAVAAIIGFTLSGDDGNAPSGQPTPAESIDLDGPPDDPTEEGVATSEPDTDGPEVPPVDCETLLTIEEVDEALGTWDRDPLPRTMQSSRREACTDQYADDPEFFVSIGPGEVTDFVSDAVVDGVTGATIDGPGDGAIWFGGDGVGTLAVWKETGLGIVVFRVGVGRPDVDDPTRREIARTLAAVALPRLPGVFVEPTIVEVDQGPADVAALGYVENLRSGVEEGRWTEGEGLVATLELLTGRRDDSGVLPDEDLVNPNATGLIRLARAYAREGTDATQRESVAALLDELVVDIEALEAAKAARDGADGEGEGDGEEVALGLSGIGARFSPVRMILPPAQEGEETCTPGLGCVLVIEVAPGVFVIAPRDGEWSEDQINAAIAAAQQSAQALEAFGDLPADLTIFLTDTDGPAWVDTSLGGEGVHVAQINLDLANLSPEQLQQAIAEQMAHSMLAETYDFTSVDGVEGWWVDGMALFLSGLIFSDVNLEHASLDGLHPNEFLLPLTERGANTWPFFQHMWNELGQQGFDTFMRSIADLQTFENIDFHWQRFNELLTSGELLDADGNPIPYNALTLPLEVIGPLTLSQTLAPFQVLRLSITGVGQDACISFQGSGVLASYRFGGVGDKGSVWEDVPTGQPPGIASTLILTATKPGASFSLKLKQREPGEDCSLFEDHGPTRIDPCDLDLICRVSGYFKNSSDFFSAIGDRFE